MSETNANERCGYVRCYNDARDANSHIPHSDGKPFCDLPNCHPFTPAEPTERQDAALDACPCCDGRAVSGGEAVPYEPQWKLCRVWCGDCGLMTANYATPAEARAAWNRRSVPLVPPLGSEPHALARRFHETYERLAPSFGYVTRVSTREFDPWSQNGRLMIAVCAEIASSVQPTPLDVEKIAEAFHPSRYIIEEMIERDWSISDLATAMCDPVGTEKANVRDVHQLAAEMYILCGPDEPNTRIGNDGADAYARAFGTSPEFWLNLERSWLEFTERHAKESR